MLQNHILCQNYSRIIPLLEYLWNITFIPDYLLLHQSEFVWSLCRFLSLSSSLEQLLQMVFCFVLFFLSQQLLLSITPYYHETEGREDNSLQEGTLAISFLREAGFMEKACSIFFFLSFTKNSQIRKRSLDGFHCFAARLVTDATTSLTNPFLN